eukprot:s7759_g3.t1
MAAVPIADSEDEGPGSPKVAKVEKRGPPPAPGGGGVTLADLQRLLEQQSASLAKSQASEIRSAIKELKQATTAELRGIKEEVTKHGDYISQLRDQGEKLEARVLALEAARAEGSTAYPGSASGEHQKNLLIMGGWDPDTHRDDLLPELRDLLSRIGVVDQFSDIFTTGPRRGHAMGIVRWENGVSDQELKRKMIRLEKEIRGASVAGKSMNPGKHLWAAISKTRMERVRAGHAGKTKRLILEINESEKHAMDVPEGCSSDYGLENLHSLPERSSTLQYITRGEVLLPGLRHSRVHQCRWL